MREHRWAARHFRTWLLGIGVGASAVCLPPSTAAQALPEAPSATLAAFQVPATGSARPVEAALEDERPGQSRLPLCLPGQHAADDQKGPSCRRENPLQPIVASKKLPPMTPGQKGYLAGHDVIDPFNLITVIGYSGIVVASNAHTAYGPGVRGFGRLTGYSLVEDMQGEFFGTFLIPTLAHQDPRYYRMPGRPFARRLLNAVEHTVLTRHDDGSWMPNYATLATYPISAELTNLYVPGVQTDAASTAKRICLGLSTDPAGQIVAEFLPDVARRIHIRVIFVQQILQQVAQGGTGGPVMTQ